MPLSIIAAVSKNNCIGTNGKLPWRIPEDMKHFREITARKLLIMGRKTWESLPKKFRPLPGRKNIVITRQEHYAVPDTVEVFNDLNHALLAHRGEDKICIGGGEIYTQCMNSADTLYITEVAQEVASCDAFFPPIEKKNWRETEREDHEGFSFVTYERKSARKNNRH